MSATILRVLVHFGVCTEAPQFYYTETCVVPRPAKHETLEAVEPLHWIILCNTMMPHCPCVLRSTHIAIVFNIILAVILPRVFFQAIQCHINLVFAPLTMSYNLRQKMLTWLPLQAPGCHKFGWTHWWILYCLSSTHMSDCQYRIGQVIFYICLLLYIL